MAKNPGLPSRVLRFKFSSQLWPWANTGALDISPVERAHSTAEPGSHTDVQRARQRAGADATSTVPAVAQACTVRPHVSLTRGQCSIFCTSPVTVMLQVGNRLRAQEISYSSF